MKSNSLISLIALISLITLTVFSRFVNLNWDRGWGFHPDENNLWGASRNIKFFSQMDPKFYAYGGFPIYLYALLSNKVSARAISAICQTLIILLLYLIGKQLSKFLSNPSNPPNSSHIGLFCALLGALSAGLVQAAHFLTVETLIGLFGLLIIYSLLKYFSFSKRLDGRLSFSEIKRNFWLILAAVSLGLGMATKISFAVFVLPLISIILRSDLWLPKVRPLKALKAILAFAILLLIAALVFLLTNPFIIGRWKEVRGTLIYESSVAIGSQTVFYTKQFIDTIPGLFQVIHIFPFITSWLFLPLFFIGLFVLCIKDRPWRTPRSVLLTACISALLSFLPFWAKWTRYVVQVLPILIIPAGIGLNWLWQRGRIGRWISLISLISLISPFSHILSVYLSPDSRLAAASWAEKNIPQNAKIFSESYDLGILPFNPAHGSRIKLFNFYELDDDQTNQKQKELDTLIDESDYFISVSQRVWGNSLSRPDKFPASAKFYKSLFNGLLGYQKVYESESTYRLASENVSEETFSVFDNPRVMIFKKIL